MRLSLRIRLLIPPALLFLGTILATMIAARHAEESVDRQISSRIQNIEATVTGPPTFRINQPILNQMRGLTGAEFWYQGTNGERFATRDDFEMTGDASEFVHTGNEIFRSYQMILPELHPNQGSRLVILYPESLRQSAINEAVRPALFLGMTGGVVVFFLGFLTARNLVRKIRDIEARTREIATGRLEQIPLPASNDEVRDLVSSVNQMTQQLIDQNETLKMTERLRLLGQFSGGLAHQLRNAASGARLAVQLYLAETESKGTESKDTEPLQVALRQLHRMETNLQQFLNLGRSDTIRLKNIDIIGLMNQVAESLIPQARHTKTQFISDLGEQSILISADVEQLSHALTNLLDNALMAAGPGGIVEWFLVERNDSIEIHVRDNGPGPGPELASRMFEPFVTDKDQGVGLGLAVVKQVAQIHGGAITWHRAGDRTEFVLTLAK